MLTCCFTLCIYQAKDKCILESIDINEYGMCSSTIVIDLPDEQIALEKKRQLLAIKLHKNANVPIVHPEN